MIPVEEMENEYIHKYFQKYWQKLFPTAEALLPVNPSKIPGYIGGSVLSQDLGKSTDMVSKPLRNLQVTYNYVWDGHNASHTAKRFLEVL